jgi:hypothetical protein
MDKLSLSTILAIYLTVFMVIVLGVVGCWEVADLMKEGSSLDPETSMAGAAQSHQANQHKRVRFASAVQVC